MPELPPSNPSASSLDDQIAAARAKVAQKQARYDAAVARLRAARMRRDALEAQVAVLNTPPHQPPPRATPAPDRDTEPAALSEHNTSVERQLAAALADVKSWQGLYEAMERLQSEGIGDYRGATAKWMIDAEVEYVGEKLLSSVGLFPSYTFKDEDLS